MGVVSILRHIIRNYFSRNPQLCFQFLKYLWIFPCFFFFLHINLLADWLLISAYHSSIFTIKTHFFGQSDLQIWMHDFQGTPLQVACRYGADQLVHCLLDAGAWLETDEVPVYDSNSPFYLASAYGHYGVIEKLFVYQPSMCNTSPPLGEKELKLLACWCHIWNYNPLNSIKRREEKIVNGLAFCMYLYC